MKQTMTTLMMVFSAVVSLRAATPNRGALRPAWEWSLEERIDARLAAEKGGEVQVVDGSEHPEWLLPMELFERALNAATSTLTDDAENDPRQAYRARLQKLGIDEQEFWSVLAKVGGDYGRLRKRTVDVERLLPDAAPGERQNLQETLSELRWRQCTERAKAYRAAGTLLGPRHLDQILYQVVAPGLSMVMSQHYSAHDLRAMDRGCQ
jgi:hypothetical protein